MHVNVVFLGHVDAGKSTLCGQLLHKLGHVDDRTIQKYEQEAKQHNRESWFLAYVMDHSEEEKERGKTTETGVAQFETSYQQYTILDAPGHKAYVPQIMDGATQADVAILIISARKGEFEAGFEQGGQTREHALLAKTVGIQQLIVAVNKMDVATSARYHDIVEKLTPFLRQAGYRQPQFVAVSGTTGENLVQQDWDLTPSLLHVLDRLDPPPRPLSKPFRLPIVDKYKDKDTVIMGKVESGTLETQYAILMPNRALVTLTTTPALKAGDYAKLIIKGDVDVKIGDVLCRDPPCPVVQELVAQMMMLDAPLLAAGYRCMLHIHTARTEVEVTKLLACLDKKGDVVQKHPSHAQTGQMIQVKLRLDTPLCVDKDMEGMNRFTLRDKTTVGVGKVQMIKPL